MELGKWKGLFEWSMKYQDGTVPVSEYKELSEEKKQWLQEACQHYMQDWVERMKDINSALNEQKTGSEPTPPETTAATPIDDKDIEEKEQLLEELQEIVEELDFARDLHRIGGLPTLQRLMQHPVPGIRWRATEVVAVCAANNPPVKNVFIKHGIIASLVPLLKDTDFTCKAKAVLALSQLTRDYPTALSAFQLADGASLINKLTHMSNHVRVRVKSYHFLKYLLAESPQSTEQVISDGLLGNISQSLEKETEVESAEVEQILGLLEVIVQQKEGLAKVKEEAGVKSGLQWVKENLQKIVDSGDGESVNECLTSLKIVNRAISG